ncbi:unnamed protein product [Prorocentrum cordatum]|uniref:Uncharacterized protein n=1 Tax=Prorocentrum cordatum TaxID=2364126 RepID=A0ABN9X0E9_9DINO|nr:unnamed protein product [Polarella glacialis]
MQHQPLGFRACLPLRLQACLRLRSVTAMSMFAPIEEMTKGAKRPAEEGRAKGGEEAAADSQGGGAETRRLTLLMAKLLLQHEDKNRGDARGDNFTVTLLQDSPLQRALAAGVDRYQAANKKAQEDAGDGEFKGNPLGKRPDVYAKQLIFRLHEAAKAAGAKVTDAAKQGTMAEETLQALDTLSKYATLVQDPGFRFTATRCFSVDLTNQDDADEEDKPSVRWVFAVNHHVDLKAALMTLRLNGCLQACHVNLGFDHAPRCRTAKAIEKIAFKKGTAQHKGKKKAKKQ